MIPIGTKLWSWWNGVVVGEDRFGNRYYQSKRLGAAKRWVLYHGMAEASKVPPEWHRWLHYMTDIAPTWDGYFAHAWEKEHLPNLTGTAYAYQPPGHWDQGHKRARASADYQAWQP
jgi:NADH:ubiquinone oxidoreductase subunit